MTAPPAPQLLPMEEADLEEAARIEIWGNPDDDMQKIIMERDRTPAGLAKLVERRRKIFRDEPITTWLKVVDPTAGAIMAWATWYYYPALTEEELARGPEVGEWPLPQWYRPFMEYRYSVMKGRPHYLLGMIVTATEYRRRGAAGMLLRWGIERADEAGVEIYLEASEAGRPFYRKSGFRELKVMEFDMSQLGYEGVDTHTCMLRPLVHWLLSNWVDPRQKRYEVKLLWTPRMVTPRELTLNKRMSIYYATEDQRDRGVA
ncbi:hypothetical protein VM1G_06025 [Cytospora mali]|uniref:N-acetyltransferase domain-containing protein n=1 Tax=Cytospora mali TaxID=578113 RepID=A0A194W214_CYTMA|nr:hypothetical protein VM1G_06025 [Valsa mali]